MRLSDARPGSFLFIDTLPAGEVRRQGIRLGLSAGSRVLCQSVLPQGPVVLLLDSQEIAVGRNLSCRIQVRPFGQGRREPLR